MRFAIQLLSVAFVLAIPRVALACPVCFGQSDAPMAWGTKAGVLFMLGVTGAVLAGFASFFIHLIRRANLAADSPAEARPRVPPSSEGPVQC